LYAATVKKITLSSQKVASIRASKRARCWRTSTLEAIRAALAGMLSAAAAASGTSRLSGTEFNRMGLM